MKTNRPTRRGFTLVELLVVIVIIAALAGLAAPMVMSQRKKADKVEAINNAKNIGLALLDFETSYSRFPDADTALTVTQDTGSALALDGTTANGVFRQLIAAGISQSEEMFYAKAAYTNKPDNAITAANALAPGEVGFGYLINATRGFTTSGNPARPIAIAPFLADAASEQFDPAFYDRKAVVLQMDGSVKEKPINATNGLICSRVTGGASFTLLQTGADTVWGDPATTNANPAILYPVPAP